MVENAGLPHVEPDPYEVVQAHHTVPAQPTVEARRRRAVSPRLWIGLAVLELFCGVVLLLVHDWWLGAIDLAIGVLWASYAGWLFRGLAREDPATSRGLPRGP
jgi:hypothetical protein